MWERYCGKVAKVAILFLITPGRLRAVTDDILQIQRDSTPRWPGLAWPSTGDYCPKAELAEGNCQSAQPSILFQSSLHEPFKCLILTAFLLATAQ